MLQKLERVTYVREVLPEIVSWREILQLVDAYLLESELVRVSGFSASLDAGEPFPDDFIRWLLAASAALPTMTPRTSARSRGRPVGALSAKGKEKRQIRDRRIAHHVAQLQVIGFPLRDGRKVKKGALDFIGGKFSVSAAAAQKAYQCHQGTIIGAPIGQIKEIFRKARVKPVFADQTMTRRLHVESLRRVFGEYIQSRIAHSTICIYPSA